ncbi:4849_t:CDS:2, partial [Gigaspora rosea]
GDQDPMTWLDEVEKAFAANLVNDDRKIAVIVPHLKGAAATWWSTSQRQIQPINVKQQVNEDVDTYHSAVQELLRRIETGAQLYPDTAKAQLFLNG